MSGLIRCASVFAPRTAAILFRCGKDNPSYTMVGLTRSKIDLAEMEIVDTRICRAQTVGILVKISSEGLDVKANVLSERLRTVFCEHEDREVSIIRPVRRSDSWTWNSRSPM